MQGQRTLGLGRFSPTLAPPSRHHVVYCPAFQHMKSSFLLELLWTVTVTSRVGALEVKFPSFPFFFLFFSFLFLSSSYHPHIITVPAPCPLFMHAKNKMKSGRKVGQKQVFLSLTFFVSRNTFFCPDVLRSFFIRVFLSSYHKHATLVKHNC